METIFHLCEAVAHALVQLSHSENLAPTQKEELVHYAASLRLGVKEEKQHRSQTATDDVIHCPLRNVNAVIFAHDGATLGEK